MKDRTQRNRRQYVMTYRRAQQKAALSRARKALRNGDGTMAGAFAQQADQSDTLPRSQAKLLVEQLAEVEE